jgi:uncharacterized HAD superfamily protein
MVTKKRKIKIGIDLDGVIIGKPPFVPKPVLEYLYRGKTKNGLSYRYPSTTFEKWIRWLSHHPLLRPPIQKNLDLIRKISKKKNVELYAISSRYSFLNGRTKQWFNWYGVDGSFVKTCLNLKDLQPHVFKEKELKKHKVEIYFEDDLFLINYLKRRLKSVEFHHVSSENNELGDYFE